jgi:hypothetical protein
LLRGSNVNRLKDLEGRNIFALLRACFGAQDIFQEAMPMRRAFSIPHVPVAMNEYSLAPPRVDLHAAIRAIGRHCLLLLRRFVDVMAAGGPMS